MTNEREAIVAEARKQIGIPYKSAGRDRNGFDCSGLVYYVFLKAIGRKLATVTWEQEKSGTQIAVNQALPGDLYFFGTKGNTSHVAIAIGNGDFIHSPEPNDVVKITNVKYYSPSFAIRMNLKETPTIDLNKYYTTNPGKVGTLIDDTFFSSVEFSESTRKSKVSKGSLITVTGIEYSKAGYPRLKTAQGYFTANKSLVVKAVSTIANYYTINSVKVGMLIDDFYYSSVEFLVENRRSKVVKGGLVPVLGMEYSKDGVPRLKTALGYVTAHFANVIKVVSTIDNYYTTNPGKVGMLIDDYFYSEVDFNAETRQNRILKGENLTIQGIEYTNAGVPRLKTAQGYITAHIANVVKI